MGVSEMHQFCHHAIRLLRGGRLDESRRRNPLNFHYTRGEVEPSMKARAAKPIVSARLHHRQRFWLAVTASWD